MSPTESTPQADPQRNANAPMLPEYSYYDGPRDTQRSNYAANVCLVLAKWVTSPDARASLQKAAEDLREQAEYDLEDQWPK